MTIVTLGHTIWNLVLILLRILGIFLGAALVLFLLAVINPIAYESAGRANDSDITLRGTVRWFFGAVKLQVGLKEK
ncbi:MAG: hypothetical protein PUB22_05860, partial [Clostridiales bacterium]|nr:hypothetical protein [Clostridiales bacterium]